MGRLIDTSAFDEITLMGKSRDFVAGAKYILDLIDAQPTAYDVEKVVAELEERRAKFDCKSCKHFYNGKRECSGDCTDALIDDLFDIVKRGGVE